MMNTGAIREHLICPCLLAVMSLFNLLYCAGMNIKPRQGGGGDGNATTALIQCPHRLVRIKILKVFLAVLCKCKHYQIKCMPSEVITQSCLNVYILSYTRGLGLDQVIFISFFA